MNNMTPEQFCYWLNGYTELSNSPPNLVQWESIKQHLATVFTKVTPPVFTMPDRTVDVPKTDQCHKLSEFLC